MRAVLILISVVVTSPVLGQNHIDGPNGLRYHFDAAGHGGLTGPVPYLGWPQLCVQVCNDCEGPCPDAAIYSAGGAAPAVTDGGQGLQMATSFLAGLNVSRHVWVPRDGPPSADGFVVYYDEFENPTAQPIEVMIRLGTVTPGRGRILEDNATVWRTQSDDSNLDLHDRWILLDDDDAFGGGQSLGVLIHGSGARETIDVLGQSLLEMGQPGDISWSFQSLVVPPNARVAILTIPTLNATRTAGLSELDSLIRMRAVDVLFAMSDDRRRRVINFDIDPANASPVANAGGPYSIDEGLPLELSGVFSYDAESVQLQYDWDLEDDGNDAFDDADVANARHIFEDNGVYQARLRVTDESGKTDIDTARVQVRNVAPRIDEIDWLRSIQEGDILSVEVRATDPGADVVTYQFDWNGDGQFDTEPQLQNRADHVYTDDGVYRARVRVEDDDGGHIEGEFEVVVENAAPVINQVVAPPSVAEGVFFEVVTIAVDPGGDELRYAYDFEGDGEFEVENSVLDRVDVHYADDGLYTLIVRVCDLQGACSQRETLINVGNTRPRIVAIEATSPINEGGRTRLTVTASDVAGDSLTYAFDFDNDGEYVDDVDGQESPTIEIPFPDDGLFSVGVRVDDGDGGIITDTVEIVVRNVAPVVMLSATPSTRQGREEAFTCTATDAGADTLSYDWDMDGDGQFELRRAQSEIQYTFLQVGPRTVRCRADDGDGGTTIAEHQIFVANERPMVELRLDSPQNEGTEVVIRAAADDVGGDALAYSFDVDGDGRVDYGPQNNPIIRHTFVDQGEYLVRVWVDDGTDQIDATARLLIVNVAPTVRLSVNSPIDEGERLILSAQVFDPGSDSVVLRWDLNGDGEPDDGIEDLVDEPVVTRQVESTDDGRFNITVWADDGDGGITEDAKAIFIRNLAPQFLPDYTPAPGREGRPYNRTIPAQDPAGANDPISYSLLDPPAGIDIEAQTGLILWTPTFRDFVNRPIVLRVRIDDGDGGSHQQALSFDVMPIDDDEDGLPDTYESMTCNEDGLCLDPNDPNDANADPDMDGRSNAEEWAEGSDPFVYEGPEPTQLLLPPDGLRINTLTPVLIAQRVEDTRGRVIQIEFELYEGPGLEGLIEASGPVLQPVTGDATWAIPADRLAEDTWYWWRARAVAGEIITPWAQPFRFRTNAQNARPTSPQLLGPPNGSRVDTLQPRLRASLATDVDEDQLRYLFRVYGPTGAIFTTGEGQIIDGEAQFQTSALVENTTMSWDLVVIDEVSAESIAIEPWTFHVDTENSAPTQPDLIEPTGAEVVMDNRPWVVASGSVDEDEDQVSYVFMIRSLAGETLEESEPMIADDGGEARWQLEGELTEDTGYIAAVHALDERGAASAETSAEFFVSTENSPPPTPTLLSPRDGSELFGDAAILVWTAVQDPEGGEVRYVIKTCVDGECSLSTPQTEVSLSMVSEVQSGKSYSWHVQAMDPEDNLSAPSEAREFSVFGTAEGNSASGASGCDCTLSDNSHTDYPLGTFFCFICLFIWRKRLCKV